VRSAAGSTMEVALWSPGRGGRLKSAHQTSTPEGSCSVLGAQRSWVGRARFLERNRVPLLTGGYFPAGPSPSVMARLCCPGREGGRQVAVLLKATRTAFERGTHPCRASICENAHRCLCVVQMDLLLCLSCHRLYPLAQGSHVASAGAWHQPPRHAEQWPELAQSLERRGTCRSPRRCGRSRGGSGGPAARHGALPAARRRPRHPQGQPQLSGPVWCAQSAFPTHHTNPVAVRSTST